MAGSTHSYYMWRSKVSTKRYTAADIQRIFELGGHKSKSADIKVLEFFLKPLLDDELEPDAVVEYGQHLVRDDARFVGAFVEAMNRVMARDPQYIKKLRLRPDMDFSEVADTHLGAIPAVRGAKEGIADMLRKMYTPEDSGINHRLLCLVRRLDTV